MGMMNYELSPGVHTMLERFDFETIVLMKQCLNNYFETGEEPIFESILLNDIWFYCKIHELAYWIEKRGSNWLHTFEFSHLKQDLDKYAKKFENNKYLLNR